MQHPQQRYTQTPVSFARLLTERTQHLSSPSQFREFDDMNGSSFQAPPIVFQLPIRTIIAGIEGGSNGGHLHCFQVAYNFGA